jgi:hypothetical protein
MWQVKVTWAIIILIIYIAIYLVMKRHVKNPIVIMLAILPIFIFFAFIGILGLKTWR